MTAEIAENHWPRPLQHRALPLVSAIDTEIKIAEISCEAVNEFPGNRMLFTALVPAEEIDAVLKAVGGIGHGVTSDAQYQTPMTERPVSAFWIYGPNDSDRFESLIHSWRTHDKTVLLPDDALLMLFDLTPKILIMASLLRSIYELNFFSVKRVLAA